MSAIQLLFKNVSVVLLASFVCIDLWNPLSEAYSITKTGTISGMLATPDFVKTFGYYEESIQGYQLTTANKSLITSILSAGTFMGALLAAPLADKLGRRPAISISCLVFNIGVAIQLATHLGTMTTGRYLAGLGVGLTSVLGPVYQAETAPKRLRGALTGGYEGFVTVGLFLAAIVSNFSQQYTGHAPWRIIVGVQLAFGAIFGIGIWFCPESPRWLVRQGKNEKARSALLRLAGVEYGPEHVDAVIEDIERSLEVEGRDSYLSLFKPNQDNKILQRTLTCMALNALQQLTGVNFIFYYGTVFFQSAGISNAFVINVVVNVVNVGMTIPGLWAIDAIGRRPLLFWGALWMAGAHLVVAATGVSVAPDNEAGQKVLIAFVCVFIAGLCYVLWTNVSHMYCINGEMFPLRNRTKGASISGSCNWLLNFALGFSTPYLVDSGPGNVGLGSRVFFIWGSMCLICAVFTWFCIPEFALLTLEQIDELWRTSTVKTHAVRRKELLAEARVTPDVVEIEDHGDPDKKAGASQVNLAV